MIGCWPCSIRLMKMLTTLRYGSSYFCFGPTILWGTAITYSSPWVRQTFATRSSAAYLAMLYGVSGFGVWSSVNGAFPAPYRAIEEQWTNRLILFVAAAARRPAVFW